MLGVNANEATCRIYTFDRTSIYENVYNQFPHVHPATRFRWMWMGYIFHGISWLSRVCSFGIGTSDLYSKSIYISPHLDNKLRTTSITWRKIKQIYIYTYIYIYIKNYILINRFLPLQSLKVWDMLLPEVVNRFVWDWLFFPQKVSEVVNRFVWDWLFFPQKVLTLFVLSIASALELRLSCTNPSMCGGPNITPGNPSIIYVENVHFDWFNQ